MAALDLREGAPMTESRRHSRRPSASAPRLLPLTEQPRWVVWPWEWRTSKGGKEKWTKPPRQARDPAYNARSNDPETWGKLPRRGRGGRCRERRRHRLHAVGSGIGAIDLDQWRDGDTGKLARWAEQLHDEAMAPITKSPSPAAGCASSAQLAGRRCIANSPLIARPAPASSSTATRRATSRIRA